MKSNKILLFLLLFVIIANGQGNHYSVYFPAYCNVLTDKTNGTNWWINAVKDDWGATGIHLMVHLRQITPNRLNPSSTSNHTNVTYDWNLLDNAIQIVINNNLDLSIRVMMGSLLPDWVDFQSSADECNYAHNGSGYYSKSDFHFNARGEHMYLKDAQTHEPMSYYTDSNGYIYRNGNRFMNFTSEKALDYYNTIFSAVVNHVTEYTVNHSYDFTNRRALEFIPVVNISGGELEYDSKGQMTGYSLDEIATFRNYLINKYSTIDDLKEVWGNDASYPISNFSDIDPLYYDWYKGPFNVYLDNPIETIGPQLYDDYIYPAGRVDFIEFKQKVLKDFIDMFADIVDDVESMYSTSHLSMGVQLGAIHDQHLEFRGFYDPTTFLEKATSFRLADIKGYSDYFSFSADYARSIGNYWQSKDSKIRGFSTETNWHLFGWDGTGSPDAYVQDELVPSWIDQITSYYDSGADAHFANFWGSLDDGSAARIIDPYFLNLYTSFRTTLQNLGGTSVVQLNNNKAIHLSSDCCPFRPYATSNPQNLFYLAHSVMANNDFTFPERNYQETGFDIVTNYMIENDPTYINKYSNGLSLTKSSKYINDNAYISLMKKEININVLNATLISDNGHGEYYTTQAVRDNYGVLRSPIHLIWRSRTDIQLLFPSANLPDYNRAVEIGWNPSPDYDFIYWSLKYGCGYPDTTKREYPEWEINYPYNNIFYYDYNIKNVWDDRTDLQYVFEDGHYKSVSGYPEMENMIDWARLYGYYERPQQIGNYNNWPYIGTNTPFEVTISGPSSLNYKQFGTYTANPQGASGEYTYQWYRKNDGYSSWISLGTQQSESERMLKTGFTLKVIVTDKYITSHYIECTKHVLHSFSKPIITENIPEVYFIENNYPNPFNATTSINYGLPKASKVKFTIYDIIGREINTLFDQWQDAGYYTIHWNASVLPSGLYIYLIKAGDFKEVKKCLLVK